MVILKVEADMRLKCYTNLQTQDYLPVQQFVCFREDAAFRRIQVSTNSATEG